MIEIMFIALLISSIATLYIILFKRINDKQIQENKEALKKIDAKKQYIDIKLKRHGKIKTYTVINDVYVVINFILSNAWERCWIEGKELKIR